MGNRGVKSKKKETQQHTILQPGRQGIQTARNSHLNSTISVLVVVKALPVIGSWLMNVGRSGIAVRLLALSRLLRLIQGRVGSGQFPPTSGRLCDGSNPSIQGLVNIVVLLLLEWRDALVTGVELRGSGVALCRGSDVVLSLLLLLILAFRSTSGAQRCGRLPGQLRLLILVRGSVTICAPGDVWVISSWVLLMLIVARSVLMLIVARSVLILAVVSVVAVVVVLILLTVVTRVHGLANSVSGLSLATAFEHGRWPRSRRGLLRAATSQSHGALRARGWLLAPVVTDGDAVAYEVGPVELILLAERATEEVASNGGKGDHANETTSNGTNQGTDLRTGIGGGSAGTRGSRREGSSADGRSSDAAGDWNARSGGNLVNRRGRLNNGGGCRSRHYDYRGGGGGCSG